MNNLFVFDTNILISAVFNQNSSPALAVKKARTIGTLVISKKILEEYITVFLVEKSLISGYLSKRELNL